MRRANLKLAIRKLILPDLPPVQRRRVVAAIEAELARLWTEQGVPPGVEAGASLPLNTSTVQVTAGARPETTGAQVARAIYSSLAGSGEGPGRPGRSTE